MKTIHSVLSTIGFGLATGSVLFAAQLEFVDIGVRPESVTKGFGGQYFVSVMGEPGPGNAVIKRIDAQGGNTFVEGLDEPKGICFTGDYLVVTDLQKVWKIDAQGNKSVLANTNDFPATVSYLNDAVAAPDGKSVYVTDMGANTKMFGSDGLWELDSPEAKAIPVIARVYQIWLDGKVREVISPTPVMLNPNGVTVGNDGQLWVAEFFKGNILEHRDGALIVRNTGYRGADAIEQDSKGNIYVSSWTQGKVWRFDASGKNPETLLEGLQSAADFYLDEDRNMLLVPDMLAGKVFYLKLPDSAAE